jgi:hypothetical protein
MSQRRYIQDKLTSGINIKTINGSSILGSGNLAVSSTVAVSTIEIDFGATPLYSKTFTVTDASCSSSSNIIAYIGGTPTGKDSDELEMDSLEIVCYPSTGSFDMYITSTDGSYLHDKFKINYIIG